jgi:hypothetical protein
MRESFLGVASMGVAEEVEVEVEVDGSVVEDIVF